MERRVINTKIDIPIMIIIHGPVFQRGLGKKLPSPISWSILAHTIANNNNTKAVTTHSPVYSIIHFQ
jgi:hypothetical protein